MNAIACGQADQDGPLGLRVLLIDTCLGQNKNSSNNSNNIIVGIIIIIIYGAKRGPDGQPR